MTPAHHEILQVLREARATYADPVSSEEIGRRLRLTPSYVRAVARALVRMGLVAVRRGNGGGYYLPRRREEG